MVVLKEEIFNSFHIWVDVVVLEEEIFNMFGIFGGCGGPEITDF